MIVPSCLCGGEWLAAMLPHPWFGGGLELLLNPNTSDIKPVRFDPWGNGTNGGIS